ncbi:DUF4178 domain-containing protein [Tenacibaculum agarivorans]|uniref:DUF4178 domain-containing protein n=1 Tax=Tenacibaculum agarivorans TaxID=1908389 RepID=UPI000A8027B9|nr:DUF4178 domain-containing protein [Tenacibaculum agarivorans]
MEIQKLKIGYLFDYKNQTWKVTDIYKINWDDGSKTTEYKVKDKNGIVRYLMVELVRKQRPNYTFWEKLHDIDHFLAQINQTESDYVAINNAKFPKQFYYKNVEYNFDERCDGTCYYDSESERVNSLDYTNSRDDRFFSIQLWDDEIEICTGKTISKSEIKNIQERKIAIGDSISVFFSKYFVGIIFISFMLLTFALQKCSKSTWNGNRDPNDSTKVHRSTNNYYRGRSSRGYGK